jgi:hypothetical protein
MTSRFVSLTARGFLGCLALILVIAALVLFRLWLGPIQVGFLTPHLERAVAGERSGRRLEIDDTVVAWDVDRHSIDLLARGVRVLERDGTRLAVLPEVAVRLDLEALLGGTIAPTSIEILAARLTPSRPHRSKSWRRGSPWCAARTAAFCWATRTIRARPRDSRPRWKRLALRATCRRSLPIWSAT